MYDATADHVLPLEPGIAAPRFPHVRVRLAGGDGSVVSLMSEVTRAMWLAGVPEADMERYCADVVVLDFPRAVAVTSHWVDLELSD